MDMVIPQNLRALAEACSFPLYIVGGYVRDSLAGLKSGKQDIDICAPVAAEKFVAVAESCGAYVNAVYANTGTVKLCFGAEEYEFACFRSDEYVRGVHAPVKTFFTDDIYADARRRDFKCNAVYYDIKRGELCDPLGGIEDIKNKVIATVALPDKVFGEDGLRLMRLARQAAQTGFSPSADCLAGAKNNARLAADVSAERIYAELAAILQADLRYGVKDAQYRGLEILKSTGVLNVILPELTLGDGMAQNEKFHRYDVLEHSLRAVKYAEPCVRLAALVHDIGKPCCMRENGNYHMHEKEGARIALAVLSRLKVPKKAAAEAAELTALHMYDMRCDARENKIRKFMVKNYAVLDKLLLLKQADYSACRDDTSTAPCVEKWRGIYGKMVEDGVPFTLKDMKVRGGEIIAAGAAPSSVGGILEKLLYDCAVGAVKNEREALLKRCRIYIG